MKHIHLYIDINGNERRTEFDGECEVAEYCAICDGTNVQFKDLKTVCCDCIAVIKAEGN